MPPRRLRVSETARRPAPWGERPPADEGEARRLLLDAAEACYERRGVSRTTVDDIAKAACVHRTTVYRYFGSRDDVLAFVLLRESEGIIGGAERAMDNGRPFGDRLLDALDGAVTSVQQSRWLRGLFSPESMSMGVAAAAHSAFRTRIRDALRRHVEAAKANGEIRSELDPDSVADWLVRVAQMLLLEHLTGAPPDDRRTVLRDFVIPGILSQSPQYG